MAREGCWTKFMQLTTNEGRLQYFSANLSPMALPQGEYSHKSVWIGKYRPSL